MAWHGWQTHQARRDNSNPDSSESNRELRYFPLVPEDRRRTLPQANLPQNPLGVEDARIWKSMGINNYGL
jgi:hypothetical protein